MIDLHGRSILLGALIIFTYGVLFSIFSLFVDNVYYKIVFLLFSIFNNVIGIILLIIVYIKLCFSIREVLKEDTDLKEILKGKKKDSICTFPYCEKGECDWDDIYENCPICKRMNAEDVGIQDESSELTGKGKQKGEE